MICRIMSYFGKFSNTSSYLYLQIRINTFMYVIVVYIRKYTHIWYEYVFPKYDLPKGKYAHACFLLKFSLPGSKEMFSSTVAFGSRIPLEPGLILTGILVTLLFTLQQIWWIDEFRRVTNPDAVLLEPFNSKLTVPIGEISRPEFSIV